MTATPISTTSFNGHPFPPEVVREILNVGLAGAPVFSALTPRTTSRASMVFATGDPSGFDWVAELGDIPTVDPGDDSAIVSMTKIAGILLLSNEAIGDSELNLTAEVGRLVGESMASKVDKDVTYGVTPAADEAPAGFFTGLANVNEATLRASVVQAAADIMTAGGMPTDVLLSPALWAAEMTRREAVLATGPLFDDLGIPLQVGVAHTLAATDALVLDRSGCFGILRDDYSIEASREAGTAWTKDALSLRIKARVAVAIPAPAKHARSVNVTPSGTP